MPSEEETETASETEEPKQATKAPEQSGTASQEQKKPQNKPEDGKPKQEKPPAESKKPSQPPPKKTDPPKPKPTDPPKKPKTAYEKPYDTAKIIEDTIEYGNSIGMTWSKPLTKDNCSWEAPIQTSSDFQGTRLKGVIESRLRRVKKIQLDNGYQPGEFHYKLYFEPIGNGEYSVYWLMG